MGGKGGDPRFTAGCGLRAAAACAPRPGPEGPLTVGTLKATWSPATGDFHEEQLRPRSVGRGGCRSCPAAGRPPRGRGAGRHVAGCSPQPGRWPCPPRAHDPGPDRAPRPAPSSLALPAPPAMRPACSPGPLPGCVHCPPPCPVSIVGLPRSAPQPPCGVRAVLWHTSLWGPAGPRGWGMTLSAELPQERRPPVQGSPTEPVALAAPPQRPQLCGLHPRPVDPAVAATPDGGFPPPQAASSCSS